MLSECNPLEVCPSCGEFRVLLERTGFCAVCSKSIRAESISVAEITVSTESTDSFESKEERWLQRNIDTVERLLAMGIPHQESKQIVHHINTHLTCVVCHDIFRRGPRGRSLFCKTKPTCKTAARRYRWLREEQNKTHTEALQYMELIPTKSELPTKGEK